MKPHDHKAIQQFEANGRDHEQIHGSNVRSVVSQKGFPPLTGRSTTLDHVLGDARLRDLKPDLEQLTLKARRPPKQILRAHLPDHRAEFCLAPRAPSPRVGFATPKVTKAASTPP